MSQQFRSYRQLTEKTPLADMLPLGTPLSVFIDPCNRCNFECAFCPTGDHALLKSVGRPSGRMDMDLFTKVIDGMRAFDGRIRRLHLFKDGEPLLNRNIVRMIDYARKSNVAELVETTTNASLLTPEIAVGIIEAGLDVIRISVEHVSSEKYGEITRTFSDFDKIRDNTEMLFREKQKRNSRLIVHVKMLDVGLTDAERKTFSDIFSPISDSIYIDTLSGWSNSDKKDFALGNLDAVQKGIDGVSPINRARKTCPEPFKTLAVNFNGLVSACCVDWSLGAIVGDARATPIADIWNGAQLAKLRLTHLAGHRSEVEVCRDCHFVLGEDPISDLDDRAAALACVFEDMRSRT